MRKYYRWKPGNFVSIPLGEQKFGFGRVLEDHLIAFYDLLSEHVLPTEEIEKHTILFKTGVMSYAITKGEFSIIGHSPLSKDLLERPKFFMQDISTGELSITENGEHLTPATYDECVTLEALAAWEPEHIIDRLRDHFDGKENVWVEQMRPKKK